MAANSPGRKRLPAILASDAERDHACTVLKEAAAEGRLTLEEFSERVSAALSARTRGELAEVTADLPPRPLGLTPHQLSPVEWSLGLLSTTRRNGSWRVGERTEAVAVLGSVVLDLRTATIESPLLTVDAFVCAGSIDVIVPEGVGVEIGDGLAIMGSREVRLSTYDHRPGMPLVHVRGYAIIGRITIRNNRGFLREAYDQLRARL